MRHALLYWLLLLLSQSALAQSGTIQAPGTVQAGVPFSIQIALSCPPPSEAPPPVNCDGGGTAAFFETSDSLATVPSGAIFVAANQTTAIPSPFILRSGGSQTITALSQTGAFARAVVQVQAQVAPAPGLGALGIFLLIVCILLVAAPNYSLNADRDVSWR